MFRLSSTFPARLLRWPGIHRGGEVPVPAVPDPRPGGGLGLLDAGASVMEEYRAPGLMKRS